MFQNKLKKVFLEILLDLIVENQKADKNMAEKFIRQI